ncbi:MAG TPA: hypothetical protein VIU15_11875 [Streptomyces sp.]
MPELYVEALATAVREDPSYVPVLELAAGDERRWLGEFAARATSVSPAGLGVLDPGGDEARLCAAALAALGPADDAESLYLVRSGPVLDAWVSMLARLVHEGDWQGEDLGLTHLGHLGGTAVFELLGWAVPDGAGASVLIVDEPPVRENAHWADRQAVVGLRLSRTPGALRIVDAGEGRPPRLPVPYSFAGPGPCDGWLALGEALSAGLVRAGDRVLLHTGDGPEPRGWVLLDAVDPGALVPVRAEVERGGGGS